MHRLGFDVGTITLENLAKGERVVVEERERAHARKRSRMTRKR